MYYAKIDKCEYTNGTGCGVSLYVSGCHFHCKGCFNKEAWDFNYGREWNSGSKNELYSTISKKYIQRFTVLGGEPLADENVETVYNIIKEVKEKFPNIKIWIYTGYKIETILNNSKIKTKEWLLKYYIIKNLVDYVVDGKFEIEKKDITLKFRGSSNQRIISKHEILNYKNILDK